MYGVIYKIVNIVNGKVYIGQTTNYSTRMQSHFKLLKKGKHFNNHLQYSYNLYGEDNFKTEIIDIANNQKELNEKEVYYIASYDETYNIATGGQWNKCGCSVRKGIFGFKRALFKARKGDPFVDWAWQSRICHKGHTTSLGHFPDPLSCEIVYNLVQDEIKRWYHENV